MADFSLVDKPIDWKNVNIAGGIEVPSADTLSSAAKYRYGAQAEAAGSAIPLVEPAPAPGMVKAVPEVPTSQPNFLRRLFGRSRGSAGASWLSRLAPKAAGIGTTIAGFGAKASIYGGPVVGAYQTATDPASEVARTGVQVGFDNPDENDLTRALSYAAHFVKRTARVGSLGAIPAIYEAAKRRRAGESLIPSLNTVSEPAAAAVPVAEPAAAAAPVVQANETPTYEQGGGTITMGGRTVTLPAARRITAGGENVGFPGTPIEGTETEENPFGIGYKVLNGRAVPVNTPGATTAEGAPGFGMVTAPLPDFSNAKGLGSLFNQVAKYGTQRAVANRIQANRIASTVALARLARYGKADKAQLQYVEGIGNTPGHVVNLDTGEKRNVHEAYPTGETKDSIDKKSRLEYTKKGADKGAVNATRVKYGLDPIK